MTAPFLVDRGDVLLRQLGLKGLPGAYVIAKNGDLRWEAPADASAGDVVAAATAAP